jgi:hypothetical protein
MSAATDRNDASQTLLDEDQARACLVLWKSGQFDTDDIRRLLNVPEPAVCRLLQAARDLARELT